jgi:hypothetical protein
MLSPLCEPTLRDTNHKGPIQTQQISGYLGDLTHAIFVALEPHIPWLNSARGAPSPGPNRRYAS